MFKNIRVYSELIKYKLSLAVVLSSVTGYFLRTGIADRHLIYLATGVFFLASGSAVLNQFTERIADSVMERTKNRPIPSGKISEKMAVMISLLLFMVGCLMLCNNGITALSLGIFNVLLYNLVYTKLKKITIMSIIPGALVGAIPPLIGFASAGGTTLTLNIIVFSIFIFLWQLPHFWLIIIKYGKEYLAAGFATVSMFLNEKQIRYLIFFWVLFSTSFLLLFFLLTDIFDRYMAVSLLLMNLTFIILLYRMLFVKKKPQEIKGAFILINSFSFVIMFLIITLSVFKVI